MALIVDNEVIYDQLINPLMDKIIQVCKEHHIAMLCTFELRERYSDEDPNPYVCTTAMNLENMEKFRQAANIIYKR